MAFQSPASAFNSNSGAGRNAHLFQPPKSPAPTITTPSFATATDYFSSGSRKRHRPDSPHGSDSRPAFDQTPGWVQCPTPHDGSYTSAGASAYGRNSMLVNERYQLAGGMDTPGWQAAAEMERPQLHDGRRWRGQAESAGYVNGGHAQPSGPLARERNGAARLHSSPNGEASSSWTSFAFSVVGKVFNFGTTVIKGFYAGGGKGFELKHSPLRTMWVSQERCSTPLPGAWQEDEFLGDFEQDNLSYSPQASVSRPPNKRRQTDKDSWVMVGTPDLESSPRRKASSTSVPRSNLSVRPSASRASSRRSLAPLPRRQSSQAVYSTGSPAAQHQQQHPAHTSLDHRRASFAPMRSNNSRPNSSSGLASKPETEYISPEAERFLKRRAKQEKQTDAAVSDLSRKIADLVKQGQMALATRISVEGGDDGEEMDEGFVDEG